MYWALLSGRFILRTCVSTSAALPSPNTMTWGTWYAVWSQLVGL